MADTHQSKNTSEAYREVTVHGVHAIGSAGESLLILREKDGERLIPLWIGLLEAQAILIDLRHIPYPQPLTHDLFLMALERLGAKITRVFITGLALNTFFAKIVMEHNGATLELDARPSDGIALALRARIPILAAQELFLLDPGTAKEKDV